MIFTVGMRVCLGPLAYAPTPYQRGTVTRITINGYICVRWDEGDRECTYDPRQLEELPDMEIDTQRKRVIMMRQFIGEYDRCGFYLGEWEQSDASSVFIEMGLYLDCPAGKWMRAPVVLWALKEGNVRQVLFLSAYDQADIDKHGDLWAGTINFKTDNDTITTTTIMTPSLIIRSANDKLMHDDNNDGDERWTKLLACGRWLRSIGYPMDTVVEGVQSYDNDDD